MANNFYEKKEKMTLEGYYESLPRYQSPKSELVAEIANRCKVSMGTVHNWLHGRTKPTSERLITEIAEITGIPKEDLWDE